ncbi:MarR family winged helix-turn-helix transcriptional regulator [Chitinimonas viridis]|uniref:MarR family winged helix-turn-helix transcriptional regulator n=1 Tax=Chitinimonas viridis TaxID=664880 RepID=A0ABT8B7K7_9NEIS|nr:MarR family winged helix-turn-helix transcriptional regulator [Chitinimonas viridis]MDN3578133.1 MarR family winged helix-turn-helix transcriptional regulator [Chitinimonas viridis]
MTAQPDWLRLDAQLCFRLYAASRTVTRCYQPLLAELGLTYPQYLAMLVLWERDDLTVKALGQRLLLDSGTLTPLLKRLEQGGLIRRERRAENEREVRIMLTPAGQDLRQRAESVPPALLAATGLSLDEAQQINTLLDRLLVQVEP